MTPGSKAEQLGVKEGDIIAAVSATAGDQLWSHASAEGVQAALSTRRVMSPTVTVRLERGLATIPDEVASLLQVPYTFTVRLKRPIGLHVVEGPGKAVYVQYIKPDLGAARSKRIEVGDQIVAMSASWGDKMWEVNNVESFVVGVRMRTDTQLSFKIKRNVPLEVYTGKSLVSRQRQERKAENAKKGGSAGGGGGAGGGGSGSAQPVAVTLLDQIGLISDSAELLVLWRKLQSLGKLTQVAANKIMSQALTLEDPQAAIDVFEGTFGFDPNPARDLVRIVEGEDEDDGGGRNGGAKQFRGIRGGQGGAESALGLGLGLGGTKPSPPPPTSPFLPPNNFVCTTAAKAYGRKNQPDKALALLPWFEELPIELGTKQPADVYFLSALVFVCAKAKRVTDAERLFWTEIPRRNLTYTTATTNSLMYMYARLNRPDDALRVYELTKQLGLECTVVTYGVLIKALMSSGKRQLQETSFEILRSLPGLGISPGVEVYNQFFEHYARTHNYRMAKTVLRIMGSAKPSVKPDAVTYGYLISCFSESKKPRSSLAIFHQMRKRGIPADAYTYMGVLKALSLMRDGLSALQVISEMRDNGVKPDKRHYSMAMFACITANQCTLAESLYTSFLRYGERPDAALYTLYLRALLQQGKWEEGNALLARMLAGKERARPNSQTLNYVLQYQVLAGRFEEASETFKLLLSDSASGTGSASGSSAVQPPTHLQVYSYQALSLALGHYSSVAQRMQRDEQSFAARLGANSRMAMDLVGMASDGDASEQFNRDANFFSPDRMLATPSPEALRFLVNCIESVGNIQQFVQVSCLQTCNRLFLSPPLLLLYSAHPPHSLFLLFSWSTLGVQGELFLEVLRALVLENQPVLAKRLLDLRESGGVRLRDEELDAAAPIIELARRALKAWSRSAQVNP